MNPKEVIGFHLPAIIDGNYEMEVEFTQYGGVGDFGITFPVGKHNLCMQFANVKNLNLDFVGWIDGRWFDKNVTTHRPSRCTNGAKHRVMIFVSNNRDEAEFKINFDETQNYIQ